MPFFRGKDRLFVLKQDRTKKTQKTKEKQKNKEGLGPSEAHLTLKPSKTNKKQNQKCPKMSFQLSVKLFCVSVVLVQKKTFFGHVAQKARTPKTL